MTMQLVLNLLDNDQRLEIFNSLPDQKAYELKNLMSYHHETAGSIMTTDIYQFHQQ